MSDHDATALAYLRFVLEERDISPTALAKKAGISSTTLTRRLNDPDHKYSLSMTTINKIEEASGIPYAPFAASTNQTELRQSVLENLVYSKTPNYDGSYDNSELFGTPIVGEVAAGLWKELNILDFPQGAIGLVSRLHQPKECFCMRVSGNSINKVARNGDILFCVQRHAQQRGLRSGDLVIVERKSRDGGLIEISAKRLKAAEASGWELHPESTDPQWSEPLRIDSVDDTTVAEIVGVVMYVVREPGTQRGDA